MYRIEMHEAPADFARCWSAAGRHLNQQIRDPVLAWIKADLTPPYLEHLSFRLGNQLFFIRIEDVSGELPVPGNRKGLQAIADGCNGHACLMQMRRSANTWSPVVPGCGLTAVGTDEIVDPVSLVSNDPIEMTDWELHHFAVQVVRDQLVREGRSIMSWNGDPNVDPSLWFIGSDGPEWVVVRACRHPKTRAPRPLNWTIIAEQVSQLSSAGHFASVSVASTEQKFEDGAPISPLLRGHGMFVHYDGLEG